MRAIIGVLGLALAAVALAPGVGHAEKPLAHQKSCDRAKAPSVQGRPGLAVIAPAGAAEVFPARWSSSCRNTNTRGQDTIYDYGLVDAATGAVIVPYAYDAVVLYSKTGALVQREDKTWTTFVAVAATLIVTALVACLIPAGRAALVDPIVALRED